MRISRKVGLAAMSAHTREISLLYVATAVSVFLLSGVVACEPRTPVATPTLTPNGLGTRSPCPSFTRAVPTVEYGLDVLPDGASPAELAGYVAEAGAKWVAIPVSWASMEPERGVVDSRVYGLDGVIEAFSERGIDVLISVSDAPTWSRTVTEGQGPPDNAQDFGAFVERLGTRYKGRIHAYEIWREQNLGAQRATGRVLSALDYVSLLCVAYDRIKSADPNALVISGGLVPTGISDGVTAIDDVVYLTQMYQSGLAECSDAVGVVAWGYNNPPNADWQTYDGPTSLPLFKHDRSFFFLGTIEAHRSVMLQFGQGDKMLWITRTGWASTDEITPVPPPGWSYAADNTEGEQAQFIVDAINLAASTGYVEVIIIYNLNYGTSLGSSSGSSLFSLLRPDGSRRPAFEGLRALGE